MPSRFGTASNSSAPQLSTIRLPSKGAERSGVGVEPDASTTCLAASVRFAPSCAVNSTLRPGSRRPWPCSAVTPAAFSSCTMPPVMPLTMPALRFCIAARSNPTSPVRIPCAANSDCARCRSSEDSSSALEGMQPALRQVPPKVALPS